MVLMLVGFGQGERQLAHQLLGQPTGQERY